MLRNTKIWTGQCHCGAVRFETTLTDGLNSALRCNCSYCLMRGAVVVLAPTGIKFLKGKDELVSYRFHSRSVEHFFCSHCGIYTHHQRRSDQSKLGVNVACLDGISPFDFEDLPVVDGANHPKDTGKPSRLAGHLRFIPSQ
ncbi:uncharacterized protein PRCAT00004305001 [Priceomyces carsonii]|uniref:uncharacterized protein n=1 Tax=Priceomyces carsonii TaxID=28549 RepID=UPI002ED91787|nr:unnamed protein product [Priceomyces carsonii]